jgi:UDPglucose 6-dehydrogenase
MMRDNLRSRVVFDGRNVYDPALVRSFGLQYYGIGRGVAPRRERRRG